MGGGISSGGAGGIWIERGHLEKDSTAVNENNGVWKIVDRIDLMSDVKRNVKF